MSKVYFFYGSETQNGIPFGEYDKIAKDADEVFDTEEQAYAFVDKNNVEFFGWFEL